MSLELEVNGLHGSLCTIVADASWSVMATKYAIEAAARIPIREQRLMVGDCELRDADMLSNFPALQNGRAILSLVRRPPEQAYWLEQMALDGRRLVEAPASLRADREIVLVAVGKRGWPLQFAAEDLKADRAVVMTALRASGHALQYAAPELRCDIDVVMAAVRTHPESFRFASDVLKGNRDTVLTLLKTSGRSLEHAPPRFQADRELVAAAVHQDERAIAYASDDLQKDPQFSHIAAGRASMFSGF